MLKHASFFLVGLCVILTVPHITFAQSTTPKKANTTKSSLASQPTAETSPQSAKDVYSDLLAKKENKKNSLFPVFAVIEVQGVKEIYKYTDRVATDKDGSYTRMRAEPDAKSKRLERLRNGERFSITKADKTQKWFYGSIVSSKDEERIGKKGWIEGWLLDDTDVPEDTTILVQKDEKEAVKTATPDKKQVVLGASTSRVAEAAEKEDAASQTSTETVVIQGAKEEYMYTYRVAVDENGAYTRMRQDPTVSSSRVGYLRNGDELAIEETQDSWYHVEVVASHDDDMVGEDGWLEHWLIYDENVPPEPEPTEESQEQPEGEQADAPPAEKPAWSINPDDMLAKINAHRESMGLHKYEKNDQLCSMAKARGKAIDDEIWSGNIHGGFRAMNPPWWITENQVGMGSLDGNFNWWMGSGIHRQAIESGKFKYSCGECWGGSCVQLFSDRL